jgi:PAT family beta-lactamase induction signal transducer AmpG
MLIIAVLGYGSGIPFTLIFSTFTFNLAENGIKLKDIGLFGAAALPFTIKFIWSPLVDGYKLPILYKLLGQRRSWLVLSQILLVIIIAAFGFLNPQSQLIDIVYLAIILSFVSATYDIAYDAIRVELLKTAEQGAGAGVSVAGYRVGILAAGGLALILAELYSWKIAFITIAISMLIPTIATIFSIEPTKQNEYQNDGKIHFAEWFKIYITEPFSQFAKQNQNWLVIIAFAILYKIGDALLGKMVNPFYQQMGFTKTEVAEITKVFGFMMTITGGIIGGWAVYKIGVMRSLLIFGVLQTLSNLTYVWQAYAGHNIYVLTTVIAVENITGAMGTAAFVAYLSSICNLKYTATQYALLTSVASLGRWLTNFPSGYMVDAEFGLGLSWQTYFVVSVIISIPGLLLIKYLKIQQLNKNS